MRPIRKSWNEPLEGCPWFTSPVSHNTEVSSPNHPFPYLPQLMASDNIIIPANLDYMCVQTKNGNSLMSAWGQLLLIRKHYVMR